MARIADNTFAASCYDGNTVAELELALRIGPDQADLVEWGFTPDKWREEIHLALTAKRDGA